MYVRGHKPSGSSLAFWAGFLAALVNFVLVLDNTLGRVVAAVLALAALAA